jgi:hypothetical protein
VEWIAWGVFLAFISPGHSALRTEGPGSAHHRANGSSRRAPEAAPPAAPLAAAPAAAVVMTVALADSRARVGLKGLPL